MKIKFTLGSLALIALVIFFVLSAALVAIIDSRVTNKLEGILWTIPAKIYARSLDIAEGSKVNKSYLIRE